MIQKILQLFAVEQAENFAAQVGKWTERFPEAKKA
jgi:hypothetical protein